MKKHLLITFLFICGILILSGCTQPKQDMKQSVLIFGKGEYPTITQALENVSENDIILISEGTFVESITINVSNIKLSGNGPKQTILSGNKSGDVISVSADHVTIEGMQIKNSGIGVYDAGIYVHASYVIINDTIIKQCYHDIYLHQDTHHNIIKNNVLSHALNGIYGIRSSNNSIMNNTIFENREYGMYIRFYSNHNSIIHNVIHTNDVGMRVKSSQYNNISDNHLIDNIDKGLYVCCGAEQNLFYNNSFMNNSINAYDSLENKWYLNGIGNYWDDYDGIDQDDDGIGDEPYKIPGGSNKDIYPRIKNP